jgi:hypothetical protein
MFARFQGDNVPLLNGPSVYTNLNRLDDAAMDNLMMSTTKRLQVVGTNKEELGSVTAVFGAMVYNLGRVDATLA